MFEAKVLAAFLKDRKDFDACVNHLDKKSWSPIGSALLGAIESYYHRDAEANSVDIDIFKAALQRKFKDVPKHLDKAESLVVEILSIDSSSVNAVAEVLAHKRALIGTDLADALLAQDDNRINLYLQEYADLAEASVLEDTVEEEYCDVGLEALENRFEEDGAWHLPPRELSKRIRGGLRPGHSVIIGARPERGKTLLGINIAAGLLMQGAKVLYIGNEDPVPDLILRLLSSLSGMNEDQLFANKEQALEIARAKGYSNCVFVGLSPGTMYEVEALVRKHEPDILIVDQMRNITANKAETNTQRLELVARELRNVARRHNCVSIAMTQVGDSGRNKLILNDGDIDGSNTGIPGACDVIIMAGSNEDYELRNLRMLTLAKNKRGGNHDSFTVMVDRNLSRVMSYEH
jgi:archaellum biogenesis ATPase FlaH